MYSEYQENLGKNGEILRFSAAKSMKHAVISVIFQKMKYISMTLSANKCVWLYKMHLSKN
jgi:hypothetical protein